MQKKSIVLRGKQFNLGTITTIQTIVEEHFSKGRTLISEAVCEELNWRQPNGRLKDRACRDVLLCLEEQGYLKLPISKKKTNGNNGHKETKDSLRNNKIKLQNYFLEKYGNDGITEYFIPKLEMVRWTKKEKLWNDLVRSFHYKGLNVIVGRSLKYIAFLDERPVACLGWGDSAWALEARDTWIGWNLPTRRANLTKIINNVRFLILPWVKVKNLASTLLAINEKKVAEDWQLYYKTRPVLLETFVDMELFNGTCYKAANWYNLGTTKGTAKSGNSHFTHNRKKYIYVKPLITDFREILLGEHSEEGI
ncbi:MAG: DUF4338 domain-containing protein [Methanobacteriaceae archaeon]|nr:DUF4338 domain-containing protein [Methanobacteriaceae archaeon]